jgi:hypothetical protein
MCPTSYGKQKQYKECLHEPNSFYCIPYHLKYYKPQTLCIQWQDAWTPKSQSWSNSCKKEKACVVMQNLIGNVIA